MERLTEKYNGEYLADVWDEEKDDGGLGHAIPLDSDKVSAIVQKLGEYEDLEEQCIRENSCGLRMLLQKWKEFFEDIQELYEYRKLEKQGKLLKLPCSIGDTVYIPIESINKVLEYEIVLIAIYIDEIIFMDDMTGEYRMEDFNKTVYFTNKEAEKALKEMEK